MADNATVQIDSSGTTVPVSADDIGAGLLAQNVKLLDGTGGSATPIAAGGGVEAGALRVTVASDSTGVLSVDDNGGSLTVDAASLPLPTGAATAAKQPALGVAGTASADVITVQGKSGMTAVLVDGSATTQPVSGTVAATQSGTWNVGTVTTVTTVTTLGTITNVVHVDDNSSSLTVDNGGTFAVQVTSVPADPFGANADAASATGSLSAKLRFIASTGIPITGTVTVASHAVTNAGTFAVQAAQSGTWTVVCGGDVAHDSADSGNPVKVGGRAQTTNRTAVSDGDRADLATDAQGRLLVEPYGSRDLDATASVTLTSTTTETTLLAAVTSTFLDLIDVIVINSSATATQVDFRDDTAGTVRFSLYVPAGATVGFSGQRWAQAVVNHNWTVKCGTSVASVVVSARFRKTK